jgi:hypothetical protein
MAVRAKAPFGAAIMIIKCPLCQAVLNLPAGVESEQVRCRICRHVFWVDQVVPMERVQASSSETASGMLKSRDERCRPKAGQLEDEEECEERIHFRELSPNSREMVDRAKSLARPAGYAMLIAFIFTTINIFGDAAIYMATDNLGMANGPDAAAVTAVTSVCHILFHAPMLTFIGIGARSLFTLGSRGLTVTAIVMNFFVFLLLGGTVVVNFLFLPPPDFPRGAALAMSSVSSLANLTAAVMAIRVLASREVADAYAVWAEGRWHQRTNP